jgi:hypothetical protein
MRFYSFILLAMCCTSCHHAHRALSTDKPATGRESERVLLRLSSFEGVDYFFYTTRSVLLSAPRWTERMQYPPLSPRKAEAAAMQRAAQIRPDVVKWRRGFISLEETYEDCWFYVFRFSRFDTAYTGLPPVLEVPVTMSGYALEAKTVPDTK